jgi:hypothetical protein
MRKLQAKLVAKCWIVLGALLLASGSNQITAQVPGPHPAYLHAIRDLREARQLLQYNFTNPVHVQGAAAAIGKIDAAIGELKNASHIDEKNLEAAPRDKEMPPEGRFHKVDALLKSAWDDTNRPESDPTARPQKEHAMQHITEARTAIAKCI